MATILEFVRELLTSPEAQQRFEVDASQYVSGAGFGDLSGEDVTEAVRAVRPTLSPPLAARLEPFAGDGANLPSAAPQMGENVLDAALRLLRHALSLVGAAEAEPAEAEPAEAEAAAEPEAAAAEAAAEAAPAEAEAEAAPAVAAGPPPEVPEINYVAELDTIGRDTSSRVAEVLERTQAAAAAIVARAQSEAAELRAAAQRELDEARKSAESTRAEANSAAAEIRAQGEADAASTREQAQAEAKALTDDAQARQSKMRDTQRQLRERMADVDRLLADLGNGNTEPQSEPA